MDAKIKKYARYLEITAWILMVMHVFQWLMKWSADWFIYGMDRVCGGDLGLAKYATLAEAFQKLPSEQLGRLKILDASFRADYGGSWIGLANLSNLSLGSRLLGFVCDGITVGILVIGFYFFIKLMAQFKQGSVFSIDVVGLLSKLAKVIFWFALYNPINRAIECLLVALQSGSWLFIPSFTLADCLIFAASYFFMILTSLMYESRQLQEEKDLTV
jgi:hypothetical protein